MKRPAFTALALFAGISSLAAAPLAIHDRGDLRADFTISFTQAGPATGTTVPNNFGFTPSDAGLPVVVSDQGAGPMTVLTGGGGYFTTGTLLGHQAPGALLIQAGRDVQGFGVTMESSFGERATYTLEALSASSVVLATATAESSGTKGEPVFLGIMDPDARIRTLRLTSGPSGPNSFVLSAPVFQRALTPNDDPATLPVVAGFSHTFQGGVTYLYEGSGSGGTPATLVATEDNANTLDLMSADRFPSLRGGDVLRIRGAYPPDSNALLGLLSSTQEIRAGRELVRVPGALNTGTDYPSSPVFNGGAAFSMSTDIGSDFIIGASSFIEVPAGARYLMFSLASPDPGFSCGVRVDWIPRTLFENWLSRHGLTGALAGATADPDGDGLTNVEEFAYGKDPTAGDSGEKADFAFAPTSGIFGTGTSERLTLTFGARSVGPLRYRPAFSEDLVHWQIGSPLRIGAALYNDAGTRAVFDTLDPVGGGRRRFGRILVDHLARP